MLPYRHCTLVSSGRAAYRKPVPKTTTRTSGRVGNRFWKLLGASTDKDQSHSMARVRASAKFDEKAAKLDEDRLRKAAQLLNLDDLAESADIPAVSGDSPEKAERATTLRPFDVQLLGVLRILAGDVAEMATGEGKTLGCGRRRRSRIGGGNGVHVMTINDYLAPPGRGVDGAAVQADGAVGRLDHRDSTAISGSEASPGSATSRTCRSQ